MDKTITKKLKKLPPPVLGVKSALRFTLSKSDPFFDKQVIEIPVRQLGLAKIVIVRKEAK